MQMVLVPESLMKTSRMRNSNSGFKLHLVIHATIFIKIVVWTDISVAYKKQAALTLFIMAEMSVIFIYMANTEYFLSKPITMDYNLF